MALDIVIMAAGKGTRMKSDRPKVLHPLAGLSLLQHVLKPVGELNAARIIVVTGHGADQVEASLPDPKPQFVRQMPQLGTGHAVQQAAPLLHDDGITLILNGDTPLIEAATLRALVEACGGTSLALLTVNLDDPSGYGRIVRAAPTPCDPEPGITAIVEHKDATLEQRAIHEVYTGAMAAPTAQLKQWLARLDKRNAQGEYYLTDVVAFAVADGVTVVAAQPRRATEVLGVNSPQQLATLERLLQRDRADALMDAGVRLADPARLDVRGELQCGTDVAIDVNCVFEGTVRLGDRVSIGAHCVIRNAVIAHDAVIHPFTHIDGDALGVSVGPGSLIGPFARLRPGAVLGAEVHIGNFVEVKNSTLADGAKANHLAYLGDATVGRRVNFGAGSITANYDGANKHHTEIGDDVHVGSNCVLVAPITLGAGATIGGGSTVTRDAPAGQLTVTRARQMSLANWKRPVKSR
jgi:bifunctional UDP-N-acetylglucosamine pyrophosphorylase/glucosamine-1-phosphate N-acetyltransferase